MREILLIFHFIGLAMGLGTSFAFMFLGIVSAKMEATEAGKFMMNALVLSKMGYIGLALLIVTGLFLMAPFWGSLAASPLLILKLVLVVVLSALIGINTALANKMKKGEKQHAPKMQIVGRLALLTALIIVVLAVYIFN